MEDNTIQPQKNESVTPPLEKPPLARGPLADQNPGEKPGSGSPFAAFLNPNFVANSYTELRKAGPKVITDENIDHVAEWAAYNNPTLMRGGYKNPANQTGMEKGIELAKSKGLTPGPGILSSILMALSSGIGGTGAQGYFAGIKELERSEKEQEEKRKLGVEEDRKTTLYNQSQEDRTAQLAAANLIKQQSTVGTKESTLLRDLAIEQAKAGGATPEMIRVMSQMTGTEAREYAKEYIGLSQKDVFAAKSDKRKALNEAEKYAIEQRDAEKKELRKSDAETKKNYAQQTSANKENFKTLTEHLKDFETGKMYTGLERKLTGKVGDVVSALAHPEAEGRYHNVNALLKLMSKTAYDLGVMSQSDWEVVNGISVDKNVTEEENIRRLKIALNLHAGAQAEADRKAQEYNSRNKDQIAIRNEASSPGPEILGDQRVLSDKQAALTKRFGF